MTATVNTALFLHMLQSHYVIIYIPHEHKLMWF